MKINKTYRLNHRYISPKVRRSRRRNYLFALICLFAGGYMLVLSLAPRYPQFAGGASQLIAPSVEATSAPSQDDGNRLIIEKLGLNLQFGPKEADLSSGAWNRYADRSNPEKGGNMVLAGHRFELGWTPQQTKARSPFYRLDTMQAGDQISLLFNGKTYHYQVTKLYNVESKDVWVEDDSDEHKLTIYTCELGGAEKGRVVIEALPL